MTHIKVVSVVVVVVVVVCRCDVQQKLSNVDGARSYRNAV